MKGSPTLWSSLRRAWASGRSRRSGARRLNGVDKGPKYRVKFTPDRPVFRLPRKLARQKAGGCAISPVPRDRCRHGGRVGSCPVHPGRGAISGMFLVTQVVHPDAQQLPREPRAADSLDGGVRRPWLEGQPDARAVERREPADRAVLTGCGSARSASSGCRARSSGHTARPSSDRSTRASPSRPPRRSIATSRRGASPRSRSALTDAELAWR